jgi:hypothetical protein
MGGGGEERTQRKSGASARDWVHREISVGALYAQLVRVLGVTACAIVVTSRTLKAGALTLFTDVPRL